MYRCEICRKVVPPRIGQLRYTVYRQVVNSKYKGDGNGGRAYREEIEQEIPVCGSCYTALRDGVSLRELKKQNAVTKVQMRSPLRLQDIGENITKGG